MRATFSSGPEEGHNSTLYVQLARIPELLLFGIVGRISFVPIRYFHSKLSKIVARHNSNTTEHSIKVELHVAVFS